MVEVLADRRRAAAEHFAELGPPADLRDHRDRARGVAERPVAGIHGHTDGHTGADGVQPDVVAEEIQPGDGVEIVVADHGPHGPDGLVFQRGGHVTAVLVHVFVGTVDDAVGAALVGGLAAPGFDGLGQGFAADLVGARKLALGGVAGGQGTGLVDGAHQRGRSQLRQDLTAELIGLDRLGVSLGGGLEGLGIHQGIRVFAALVHHQRLEALGAHDRPQPAAAGGAAGPPVKIRGLDGGDRHLELAGGSDTGHAVFLPEDRLELLYQTVGAHTLVSGGVDQLRFCGRVDLQQVALPGRGLAFNDHCRDSQPGQIGGHRPAHVALLDAAGQRAFGAHRKPAGIDQRGPAEITGGEYQPVFRPQGVAGGRHLNVDQGGGQSTAAQTGVFGRQRLFGDRFGGHVNSNNLHHGLLYGAKGLKREKWLGCFSGDAFEGVLQPVEHLIQDFVRYVQGRFNPDVLGIRQGPGGDDLAAEKP